MIKSLLIANRGEIACRVIRTARRMGIRTVAVYSEADRDALHVRMADEAHLLGPAPAAESYLRTGRILAIASEAGVDAIHPGYGFLSENADFAELTRDAGMTFVGPPPDAIRAMGLKDKAKEIMEKAGVPVVPGFHGRNQAPQFLKRKAYEIGYPVLVKAVAGGGGKGMRKVEKALEFDDALSAAKREAKAAFGNDTMLIERFVKKPRHIEIQVFADSHGNVVHLFERDCSLQRRHQKVIEEAPAPGMNDELRTAMGTAACDAARAVGYEGAGTVEFIVDGDAGLSEDGFFFMEMNTRLQVEHPVTEMITGLDLVEWQLRVAAGEPLPKGQDDLAINGHAVEARIYAEDANAGFLPSTGRLVAMDLGAESDGLRVDTGVEQGDVISPYYDPMIAKLIVHAPDRAKALDILQARLENARIAGPVANTAFLAALCGHKGFRSGKFDTGLIDGHLDKLINVAPVNADVVATGLSALLTTLQPVAECPQHPWSATDAFQVTGSRSLQFDFLLNGEPQSAGITYGSGKPTVTFDGTQATTSAECEAYLDGDRVLVLWRGQQWMFEARVFELVDDAAAGTADGAVMVPMHGRITTVTVSNGDAVEEGDILFSIEAMKMEHTVVSPRDGIVADLAIDVDEQAEDGQLAMVVEAKDAA